MGVNPLAQPLVNVIRGNLVESQHWGHLAVTNREGKTLFSLGNPNVVAFWRSAAKPFQAIPLVERAGIEKYGFTGSEIALITSSHNGEPEHLKTLRNILDKLGLAESCLQCGPAFPMHTASAQNLIASGEKYAPAHNACSGKHAGMLALALLLNASLEDYIKKDHPVQQEMLKVIGEVCSLTPEQISLGVDGCGVPVFALPIRSMAMAYARFSLPEGCFSPARAKTLQIIRQAMTSHPYFVAGTDRLDTLLMETTKGRLVAKPGAEGVYCIGMVAEGTGLTLKIQDGHSRAIGPVVIHVLKRLGYLTEQEFHQMQHLYRPILRNHRGDEIGHLEVAFAM